MSFPPLTHQWTVKSEASWPGAEYTRRTRLKTVLSQDYGEAFVDEMKKLLGDNHFAHYERAMHPVATKRHTHGAPPGEYKTGGRKLKPQAPLQRAKPDDDDDLGGATYVSLSGTTRSLGGTISKSRNPELSYTAYGAVPAYMFEDREQMDTLDEWFHKYGRPTPNAINLGSRQFYTTWLPSDKRCCGEPSHVTITKKGFLTS